MVQRLLLYLSWATEDSSAKDLRSGHFFLSISCLFKLRKFLNYLKSWTHFCSVIYVRKKMCIISQVVSLLPSPQPTHLEGIPAFVGAWHQGGSQLPHQEAPRPCRQSSVCISLSSCWRRLMAGDVMEIKRGKTKWTKLEIQICQAARGKCRGWL